MLVGYVGDVETTGLDPQLHDIIEVSLWRMSDGEQRSWLVKPLNEETIQEESLKINKHKREDILGLTKFGKENYLDPAQAVMDIEEWMMEDDVGVDDRAFIGANPSFDISFLEGLWKKVGCEDSFPFGKFVLDVIQITRLIDFCNGKRRERYNLGSLVKDFQIKKEKAHRADADVRMTKDLFLKQTDSISNHIVEAFADCLGS